MERKIKFEYGFKSQNGIVKKVYELSQIPNIASICDVWNELPICYVRQFTGLQDIKGKDIYEGDIIEEGKVLFCNESLGFFVEDENKLKKPLYGIPFTTIIGNIHENHKEEIKNNISVQSRIKHIKNERDLKIVDFIIDYSFEDSKEIYTNGTVLVPLYRVLDAILQNGEEYKSL